MIAECINPQIIHHFFVHMVITFCLWIIVIFAITIDLWDGCYTAKVINRSIRSHKLRVTILKVSEYWRFLLIGLCIDTIGVLFPAYYLPFLTILFSIGLVGVECKSLIEHAQLRKSKVLEAQDIIKMVIECANEEEAKNVLKKVGQYLNTKKLKQHEKY